MSRDASLRSPSILSSQTGKFPQSLRTHRVADPRIQGILEAMCSNSGDPLSVGGMAGRLGLSRSRFEHLFRKQTGQAPKAVLLEFRFAKAKALLADWTHRVKEVADACGCSSTAGFTKAFRRQFGKSPSDYRRSTFRQQTAHPDN
jgi:AraC family transcriptional regulator of arabinose operon